MQGTGTRRWRIYGLGVTALAVLSISAGMMTMALFTDEATVTDNTFTAGTIDISASPATAAVTYTNMLPGDVADGSVTVANNGTGALRYAMTTSADNADTKALRDQLVATIKTEGTSCAAFDGTQLYTGSLASAAFGDATTGAHAGDRTLAAAASEVLCFKVELPLSTGNAFQGATTTATFTFSAEQTKNNP